MTVLKVLIACLIASAPAVAAAPLLNATLEPRQISMGESAQLTITGTAAEMDALTLPVVSGLEFRVVGQSRRIEIINGATLSSTSVILRVIPQTAGIFTIPGITPKSQPLVLRVNPDNGSGNGAQSNNPYSARPPGTLNGSSAGNASTGSTSGGRVNLTANGAAFIRMDLPKRDVYVGESIPVDIEVGMRSGFVTSLNGLPTLTGTDFTLNNLSHKPERVEKLIDGQPFTVLTWHSVLAPVKPGTFKLSVESPLTIRVRTRPARDSMIDDLLGDPFMQNFFGATVPKDITVTSPPAELKVLALPTEGRPADFSGAVGTFKIASDLSAPSAAVGDPLTLRLHVSGSGNFDRVDTPMLEHVDHWKTYPPKSSFTQSDAVGYKGEKTFEQPLIASQPGAQTLPALTFSYFDPSTQRYETVRSTPPAVTIAPALAEGAPPAPPPASVAANAGSPGEREAAAAGASTQAMSGLRPDHAITGDWTPAWLPRSLASWVPHSAVSGIPRHSLIPLYLRAPFLVMQSLLALAFAGGWFGLRSRARTSVTPALSRKRPSKANAALLQQLQTAARSKDSTKFFSLARDALRHSLAARWGIAADTIAPEDWSARLDGNDVEEIRELFTLADEARYGGRGMSTCRVSVATLLLTVTPMLIALTCMGIPNVAGAVAQPESNSHPDATTDSAATPYSADSLYNLGNAYARAGKPGLAVLNYERARLLAPYDPDLEANLSFVRRSAKLPSDPPSTFDRAARIVGPTTLAWSGLIGLILAGSCWVAGRTRTRYRGARRSGIAIGVALVALTVCNGITLWPTLHAAVVLHPATPARVSPALMGDPVFELPEAETVNIAAEHEDFVLIETRTGKSGWVARANLAPVVPWQ